MKDLQDGAISAAEARKRLRDLGRLVGQARDAAAGKSASPADAEKARWLDDLLVAARTAELLAGEAAGSGGEAAAGPGAGTVEERLLALAEGLRSGFAAAPPRRRLDALADFAAAAAPRAPDAAAAPAPSAAGTPAVDWDALLAAPRRALAERNWPRWKYDPVIDRYFGIETEERDGGAR
jgi:hypothetical protein